MIIRFCYEVVDLYHVAPTVFFYHIRDAVDHKEMQNNRSEEPKRFKVRKHRLHYKPLSEKR